MVKNLPASAGDIRDMGSIPGLGRSPGEGNGNPLQYSYLENPMDRGSWQATIHGVTKSWTRLKQLSNIAQSDLAHVHTQTLPGHDVPIFVHDEFVFFFVLFCFYKFYFIFKLYITVLDLPNIKMNPPQVYMCSPS